MLFERLSQEVLRSSAGDYDRVFLFNKGKDKTASIGHSHILLQDGVGKRKVLRDLSGIIPWDQKPCQG